MPGLASAEFGDATIFWNEGPGPDAGVECRRLVVSGVQQGYVARYHVVKGRLFAFRCVENDDSAFDLPEGTVYGHVPWQLSGLEDSQLRPVAIPGWSLVSNPSFCGPYVAYWRIDEGRVSAAIHDLVQERGVAMAPTALPDPHTDFPKHFPAPVWDAAKARADFLAYGSAEPIVSLTAPR